MFAASFFALQTQPIDSTAAVLKFVVVTLLIAAGELALVCGMLYLIYLLLTLPLRRNERARIFLDLLELGLRHGQTPEQAVTDASTAGDPSTAPALRSLAAQIRKGLKLGEALRKDRLLPPQLTAMLQAGERAGDIARVLPACRQWLGDGVSQVRGALNYLLVLAFMITPFTIMVPIVLQVIVLPKFKEIFINMLEGHPLPALTVFIFEAADAVALIHIAAIFLLWTLMLAYVGGPALQRAARSILPGAPDRLFYLLPWRRKRLQRDFSSTLAILLDAGTPETDAVTLAGEATDNAIIRKRAARCCDLVRQGIKLPDAIRVVDDSREFQWRLSNALARGGGFVRALHGWQQALDARAFQSEQTAAQILTTLLVLFNGLIVGAVVVGMFLPLIQLMTAGALW